MVLQGHWLLPCHPFPPASCPLEAEIGASPDDRYIRDASVTSRVFSRCAHTTPVSEQQEVVFPSNFGTLVSTGGVDSQQIGYQSFVGSS